MFGYQGLNDLERRKQELIAGGALKRARLATDFHRLEPAFAWVDTLARAARQAGPILSAVGPWFTGWWSRTTAVGGLASKLTLAAGLFRGFRSFYRGLMGK